MMSITEETVVAGVMTFFFYGMVPVGIILYLGGAGRRRRRKQAEEEAREHAQAASGQTTFDAEQTEKDSPSP